MHSHLLDGHNLARHHMAGHLSCSGQLQGESSDCLAIQDRLQLTWQRWQYHLRYAAACNLHAQSATCPHPSGSGACSMWMSSAFGRLQPVHHLCRISRYALAPLRNNPVQLSAPRSDLLASFLLLRGQVILGTLQSCSCPIFASWL